MDLKTLLMLVTFLVGIALGTATEDKDDKRSDRDVAAVNENGDLYDVMSSADAESPRLTRGYIFRYGKRSDDLESAKRLFRWGKREDEDAYKRLFRWGKRGNENAYKRLFRWGKRSGDDNEAEEDQYDAAKRIFRYGKRDNDDLTSDLMDAVKKAHIFRYGRAPQGSPHVPFRFGEKDE